MQLLTKTKLVRLSENEFKYLDILHKKYKINSSQFIRDAILEKMKRDVPKIRLENKDDFICPF